MAQATWRPYQFQGLPKYSRERAAMLASFGQFLSHHAFGQQALDGLAQAAAEIYHQKVELEFDHHALLSVEEVAINVPEHACLVRIGLLPKDEKVLWQLDPVLANAAVDRVLGAKNEDFALNRPFTEIEHGVLLYALLKMAHAFQQVSQAQLAVRIEGFDQSLEPYRALFSEATLFHALSYKVIVGHAVGFSRIFVPTSLTQSAFAWPEAGEGTPEYWQHLRQNLHRIGERTVPGRVQIATLDLNAEDRQALDVGDIVLLEHHQLTGSGENLAGNAQVHLGRGKNGHLVVTLLWRNGRADLQIVEIALEQEPQTMSEEPIDDTAAVEEGEGVPEPNDNLAESEGLLRDVPAPVIVELGRIKLSTSQVIRLRAGQILRLGRSPTDPVDLVVNNRIFARGELIEVEGELGVRLVQLAK